MSDRILHLLNGLKLLADVPPAARARLSEVARPVRYAAGDVLFRRGDSGEGMVVVLDGLVRIHLSAANGREVTLALAGAGEPIGEITLIDGGLRSADATAITPVSAVLVRHADATALIRADAEMAAALLRTMAARLRRITDQVEAVGLLPLSQRLAAALLQLAAADPSGLVRLSQGHIATLIAASRPKVNAALSEYRALGLVESVRAGLRLLDQKALRALAEGE
jgi:CRP-like cAMP-binding protein